MNPFVKASLTIVAVAAILYALLPPAPDTNDNEQPYTVDLRVPQAMPGEQAASVAEPAEPATESAGDDTALTEQEPATAEATEDAGLQQDTQPDATAAPPVEAVETLAEAAPEEASDAVSEPVTESADQPLSAEAPAQTESPSAEDLAGEAPLPGENLEQPADASVPDAEQAAAAEPEEDLWIEREIESGDTLAAIFKDFGLSSTLLAQLVDSGPAAKTLANIRPGQKLAFRLDADGNLQELRHERSSIATLRIERNGEDFDAQVDEKPIEVRTHTASGTIDSSLFGDGQNAGLSDKLIMDLAELFNWDIDFARELREGDRFSVIYEADYVDGEKYRDSDILAAEFVNNGKSFRAIRFQDPDGLVEYYAPDGTAKKKAFIKTPVKFSRISSRFTNSRWHPVLKRWRSHKGVDYAAPTGTPIKAAGKGKVSFVGRQRGYGKVIYLQHGDRYTTVYGHLSGFAKGLNKGDSVKQGDVIGYVGQTGLATGPHLHYEFRVNGKHVDPLSHDLPTAMPLPAKYMAEFKKHAEPLVEQLNILSAPQVAEHRSQVVETR